MEIKEKEVLDILEVLVKGERTQETQRQFTQNYFYLIRSEDEGVREQAGVYLNQFLGKEVKDA